MTLIEFMDFILQSLVEPNLEFFCWSKLVFVFFGNSRVKSIYMSYCNQRVRDLLMGIDYFGL